MTERVEIMRMSGVIAGPLADRVYAAGICRRVVEVTWDSGKGDVVFSVKRPVPKRIAEVANIKRAKSA